MRVGEGAVQRTGAEHDLGHLQTYHCLGGGVTGRLCHGHLELREPVVVRHGRADRAVDELVPSDRALGARRQPRDECRRARARPPDVAGELQLLRRP